MSIPQNNDLKNRIKFFSAENYKICLNFNNFLVIFKKLSKVNYNQFNYSFNLNNCLILVLILVSLIHCSNCINLKRSKENLINLQQKDELLLNEFNLALSNFLSDWKIKNPSFNLSAVDFKNSLKGNALREKRELNLEDDLEYVLKNKEQKKLFNRFDRKIKSIENSNEFNSLEDKSLEQESASTCITCKSHEALKKYRVEQIKLEILRKLNLQQPPTVNLSSIPRQLILNNFLKNDPSYQNDQDLDDFLNEDDEMHVKQVVTFSEKAPSHLKLDDNIQYFSISKHLYNTEIMESELSFKVKTTPEFNSLNNTANVKVAEKKLNIVGSSAWITIDINNLMSFWANNPDKNLGLFIHCYNQFGQYFEQPYLKDLESNTFITTSHRTLRKTRSKRSRRLNNDCNKDVKKNLCCRWPLKVNFEEIGYDFIIGPQSYDAYYCAGKCVFGNSNEVSHSSFMYHLNKSSSVCCTGQKYSGISIVYMENKQIVYGEIKDMVVDRCGCS